MEREPSKEEVVRDLSNFLARRAADMQSRIPKTAEELRQEFGHDIKERIGGHAASFNQTEPVDIPLPSSEDRPNEQQSLLYVPPRNDLFLIRKGVGENALSTAIELTDEDWVDHGPTVLNVLMDIKHSQNPPPIPQKQ